MKNCRHFQNQIADHVSGRLTAPEQEAFQNHCNTCSQCADALRQETLLANLFAGAKAEPRTPEMWGQIVNRLPAQRSRFFLSTKWIFGSGLVTATAMATLALLMFQTPPRMNVAKQPSESPTTIAKEQPYVSVLNEMQDTGVKESQMLISASHSVQQVAASNDSSEGEVQ